MSTTPSPTPTPPSPTPTHFTIPHNLDEIDLAQTDARYTAYLSRGVNLLRAFNTQPVARYLAYTSDVGEGFRSVTPKLFVTSCYALSWGYVLLDCFLISHARYEKTHDDMDTLRTASHRVTFNALASMIFPMFTIHTVVHQSQKFLANRAVSPTVKKWVPVGMGLACIPALPFIFDHPVETACDWAWNRFWPSKYPHLDQHHSTDVVSHLGATVHHDQHPHEIPQPHVV